MASTNILPSFYDVSWDKCNHKGRRDAGSGRTGRGSSGKEKVIDTLFQRSLENGKRDIVEGLEVVRRIWRKHLKVY